MAICKKCGKENEDSVKFCTNCGESLVNETAAAADGTVDVGEKIRNLNNTADTTASFDATDIENNKILALLSYLSWLVLIPLFAAKHSKFARFHTNQGLVLLIVQVIWGIATAIVNTIITAILPPLGLIVSLLLGLVNILFLVLAIIGIVNAVTGKAKELPVIGKFKILK